MKIGLFGGTFNPIHNGHLSCAMEIKKEFLLDKVLFIPAKVPVHKDLSFEIKGEDRLRMISLAIDGIEGFEFSDIELNRETPSYAYLTITDFKKMFPKYKFYFILGVDAFNTLKTWYNYHYLINNVEFILMNRPGENVDEDLFHLCNVKKANNSFYDISSSDIRDKIISKKDFKKDIPGKVYQFIIERGLYTN